jgi:hypothetical protein
LVETLILALPGTGNAMNHVGKSENEKIAGK